MNSMRGDRAKVVRSIEDGFRCIDILETPDRMFVFKEFRQDPEDAGRWTLVKDYSERRFPTQDDALLEAAQCVAWLAPVLDRGFS